ncbi:cytochrome c-type biogenesis protein [Afifella pfennigii]|uniref:cytochrome c-type biogenesis protein n=1 Tax=Afifella pfennigii TaxID=209897 RepID=UPI00047B6102|nr:cytochrome c-type biogenesis protein [Afifella pfennigii]
MKRLWIPFLLALGLVAFAPAGQLAGVSTPAHAVEPDEMLDDPKLEARAREISAGLRCLVCQNQSIDDSNAELAKDLRVLVRERLVEGDSNAEVRQYLVDRYGEFVLLRPVLDAENLLLWVTPVLALLVGAFIVRRRFRQNASATEPRLSPEEEAELASVLKKDPAE